VPLVVAIVKFTTSPAFAVNVYTLIYAAPLMVPDTV
jgi:hypothetical protein